MKSLINLIFRKDMCHKEKKRRKNMKGLEKDQHRVTKRQRKVSQGQRRGSRWEGWNSLALG